jgi:hypothetical protein
MADLREEPVVSVAIQTEPRERWGIIQTMDGLVRGGRTVRIGNAACWCWAVIGDHECDPGMTGFRALLRPVRSWSPARPRPGWRSWPDQEPDHLALEAPDVSHHSPADPPSRTGTTSRPAKERTHE